MQDCGSCNSCLPNAGERRPEETEQIIEAQPAGGAAEADEKERQRQRLAEEQRQREATQETTVTETNETNEAEWQRRREETERKRRERSEGIFLHHWVREYAEMGMAIFSGRGSWASKTSSQILCKQNVLGSNPKLLSQISLVKSVLPQGQRRLRR